MFADPIRVLVAGAKGRMGREVVRALGDEPDMTIAAQVDASDDLAQALVAARPAVMVDFTVPSAALANVRAALAARVVCVVGTTGLSPADLGEIAGLCRAHDTAALVAPNFAIGAVLLMRFAREAALYLPDVEIVEMHHEKKIDAPSGTAARTAELIAQARTKTPARGGAAGVVPIHSIRLPGFVASQEVIFGGPGQRLSLRHDSIDRASFMPGVVLAVRKASHLRGLVVGLENLL